MTDESDKDFEEFVGQLDTDQLRLVMDFGRRTAMHSRNQVIREIREELNRRGGGMFVNYCRAFLDAFTAEQERK